jgi:predicted dehydrogenase
VSGSGRVGIGVVGAGNISTQYLQNLTAFPDLEVRFVADVDAERARSQAQAFGVPGCGSVADLLADDGVEIVVNLTPPATHTEVVLAALDAGKHSWTEKPLSITREDGAAIVERSKATGRLVGCAPDTFLGPAIQAARRLVESGEIGRPLGALSVFQNPGPERWHPNPAFLFAVGAGPVFDLGPYYLTALVQLLGPVARVTANAGRSQDERIVHEGPLAGSTFPVETPTHVQALLEFASGVSAISIYSFDSGLNRTQLEVTGADGVLEMPDPNWFVGDLRIHRPTGVLETIDVPKASPTRGMGVLDLARAIREGRRPRASAEQGFHVLDVMASILEAAELGRPVEIGSSLELAPPLEPDWDPAKATLA